MAEPREAYEARAVARYERIRELRAERKGHRAIAETRNVSIGTLHYALTKHKDAA